jgi:hypothetical protein
MTRIKVLQHHIQAGTRGSSRSCPIALAVQEMVGPLVKVVVTCKSIMLLDAERISKTKSVTSLPYEANDFVKAFDAGFDMQPLSFSIPVTFDPVQKAFLND